MLTKNDLLPLFNSFVQSKDEGVRRFITGQLERDGQRHTLCRFVAQLALEDYSLGIRFARLLAEEQVVSDHTLRWCRTLANLIPSGRLRSDVVTDLCDLIEADDKLVQSAINNMSTTARSCKSGEAETWAPNDHGFKAMRENLETTIAMLGGELPEYDEDEK